MMCTVHPLEYICIGLRGCAIVFWQLAQGVLYAQAIRVPPVQHKACG